MTSNPLKLILEKDFLAFIRYNYFHTNNQKFEIRPYHIKIIKTLYLVYLGYIDRLIINIPPRHSKTELAVIQFIAWCLANNPKSKFIYISYSKQLVLDGSAKIKKTIESDYIQSLWDLELQTDSKSKEKWYTKEGGGVYAVSSDGAITGFGAGSSKLPTHNLPHLELDYDLSKVIDDISINELLKDVDFSSIEFGGGIIIDDPNKPKEINSTTIRESINQGINNTIKSRLNNKKAPIILIMQRLHEEDMTGFLLGGGSGEKWYHLKLPVVNEVEEPLRPNILGLEEIEKIKKANPYVFAGQYMQEPAPIGGAIFKDEYWQYYDVLPKMNYLFQVMDTAQKTKEQNDYTVIATWGMSRDGNLCLIDICKGKWEAPELITIAKAQYTKHKPRTVYIEDKSSGTGLIQTLRKDKQIPIQAVTPNGRDKISRASDTVPYIASGYVYLPKNAEFLSDFLLEHRTFPTAKHDDTVDTTCYAVQKALIERVDYSKIYS